LRAVLWHRAKRCLALFCGSHLRGALFLLTAITSVGFALAGDSATVEAQEYSAYSDPEKTAISVVLSEEQNLEEFQEEFGLSDEQIQEVSAAVLKENEAVAKAYAESEQIVQANKELPEEQIAQKIDASGYHEKVRAAIAETKSSIESMLPEGRRAELKTWVDAKFAQENQQLSEASVATDQVSVAGGRGVRCRVFATQYQGYTRREVALPYWRLKSAGGFRVRLSRGGHRAKARVKEVGPWNIYDNYWNSRRAYERMNKWDDLRHLPRCTPWAQAAYFRNYNHGRDQYGRKVTNPAGVDLTPRVARALGLKKYQNAWIYVRYPWVRRH
jgi:flagellar biosynthesis regulator FlaF